ncbi:hypothetical protein [Myceligenerans indicum]|uniref:Uncharacterized protein n=1 Tax=Myceligenerans indicum TaxID=2593663 RepID=A0ABS1LR40_9MICO|nr:hypothetical protein [Myceligenerans indicum]MBL0888493.1 hypothetical protein [Myceligenerans indicum]
MVMIVEVDKSASGVVADAESIVRLHRADAGGMCLGCYELWCAFAWHPCPRLRWAQMVLAESAGR